MIKTSSFESYFIGHNELITLATIDVIIVYLFCTMQMGYNILTGIYIFRSNSKVNRIELWRAYLFALAPVVYSILPILMVLYFYNPNGNYPPIGEKYPGIDFAKLLVWIHLPPILLVFCCIIVWNIICSIHNKKTNSISFLKKQGINLNNQDQQIHDWDTNTKVIFRKAIYKHYLDKLKKLKQLALNNDLKGLEKELKTIEGWYIAKQRFQFFWCTKKAYKWIKLYYKTHYLGLRYHAYQTLLQIESNVNN